MLSAVSWRCGHVIICVHRKWCTRINFINWLHVSCPLSINLLRDYRSILTPVFPRRARMEPNSSNYPTTFGPASAIIRQQLQQAGDFCGSGGGAANGSARQQQQQALSSVAVAAAAASAAAADGSLIKVCAVCGDRALSCNFGAITCESCKAFFRRNATRTQVSHVNRSFSVSRDFFLLDVINLPCQRKRPAPIYCDLTNE